VSLRLRSFTYFLVRGRSDKCPVRFQQVCLPSPDWLVSVLARENRCILDPWRQGRHAQREVTRKLPRNLESDTIWTWTEEVRRGSVAVDLVILMVALRGRAHSSARIRECIIIVYIIVIWYILCILWTFVFNLCAVNSFASLFIIFRIFRYWYLSLLLRTFGHFIKWTLLESTILIELHCCNLHVVFIIYLYIVNKPTI